MEAFRRSWRQPSSLGDILGNIALFVPYGFLGYLLFGHERGLRQALLPLCTIWAGLAVGSQLAQLYIPSRSPSLFDVYGNGFGFLIGVAAAYPARVRMAIDASGMRFMRSSALTLLGLWISARLLPFVPTIDWQSYKDAVKPLLLTPRFAGSEFLLVTVCWLVAARLAKSILSHRWRSLYLPIGIAVVLGLEVIIVNNEISLTDVCAGTAAVLLWLATSRHMEDKPAVLAWLLLGAFAADAIFPFAIRSDPAPFNWLLFSRYLEGSMLINAGVLCEKLFVFGAVLWLLKETRPLSLPTIAIVTAIVSAIEVGQIWIVGRTPDLTDPLLVVVVAWLLCHTGDADGALTSRDADEEEAPPSSSQLRQRAAAAGAKILRGRVEPSLSSKPPGENPAALPEASPPARSHRRRNVALAAGGACLTIMLSAYVVVRLPGVPYNVRELFLFGGTGIDLFFFSLALLGFGWGSAWMGRLTATSRVPALGAPLAAVTVSIVIYLLFASSVTRESIMDVAGSSVVVHRVGVRGVLGQSGIDFVASVGADKLRTITDVFEPVVRFGALIGPLIIFLGATLAAQIRQARQPAKSWPSGMLAFSARLAAYLLFMLPWLYFCKVIAFDWSSTDNLNELIARDGRFGLGGGGYLYGLIGLITLCAGLLAWSTRRRKRDMAGILLVSVASVPVGWWLLNAGLYDHVTKYGLEFSGVDFLLGPDRQHLISTAELFWRWSFIQLCAVAGLAFGAALYLGWIRDGTDSIGALPHGEDKRLKTRRKIATSELEVRLHRHQLDFLKSLTRELGGTLSSTIGAIIDCLDQEMRRSSSVESSVYMQISNPSATQSGDLAVVSQYVDLSQEQTIVVLQLQERVGVSASRAVRRLIDIFMLVSGEEAKGTAENQQ